MHAAFLYTLLAAPPSAVAATVASTETTTFEQVAVTLSGFVQPRFTWQQSDPDNGFQGEVGFALRRARLAAGSTWLTRAEGVDGWNGPALATGIVVELAGTPSLQDGWAEARLDHPLQFRIGQFKAPTTRNQLTSGSSLLLADLAHLANLAPTREIGAMLHGDLGRHHVDWAVGAFNGGGRNQLSNSDDQLLFAGRLAVSPLGAPGQVVDVLAPDWTLLGTDSPIGATNPDTTVTLGGHAWTHGGETPTWGAGAEAFAHARWVNLQFEWTTGEARSGDAVGGWYVQAAVFPPMVPWAEQHLALIGRVSQVDPDEVVSDPAQLAAVPERELTGGVALFAGAPAFRSLHGLKGSLAWTSRQELEGTGYANDELLLQTQLAF